jgi:hypothetical protein
MNAQSSLPRPSHLTQRDGKQRLSSGYDTCTGKLQATFITKLNVSHITLLPIQSTRSAGAGTAPADRFVKSSSAIKIERKEH